MSLLQVVYVSSAVVPFMRDELHALADLAARKNRPRGITGILLHHDGSFLQAIEGEAEGVRELVGRIGSDPRHRSLVVLMEHAIQAREFGEWSMGLVDSQDLDDELRAAIEPVVSNDVGLDDSLLVTGRAHRLIRTFARIAR